MFWTDMHAHLDKLEEGPDKAVELALNSGVKRIITIGTEPSDLPVVLELSQRLAPHVYCTLGIHPHEGGVYDQQVRAFIEENATNNRVIAVGEIGLDYYYQHAEKQDQIFAFTDQLELAQKLNLPVEIHTRDAEQDTVEILKKFKGKVNGLIHCFTGTEWLAKQCLDLGYNISISGVVTFKNAHDLRKTVEMIPLDRLHVETDAPFLAPVPLRGKTNTPAYVIHTAKVVADLKKITIEELCLQTNKNAETLFKKLNPI